MDLATAIGLAGTAYKLFIFTNSFVRNVKGVLGNGGPDYSWDLSTVAKNVQAVIRRLED